MNVVEFKHDIGSIVSINTNGMRGIVTGNFIGKYSQKQALVEFADATGVIHQEYIDEDNLLRRHGATK